MTLETLPVPLQKCVETVRERFVARHLNISSAVIEECALGILNVALETGVAREEIIKPSQFYNEKHEIRISLIRTGDT